MNTLNLSIKNGISKIGPEYITLDITNKCNLNCIACWTYSPLLKEKIPSKEWFNYELSYETIKKLFQDLNKLKTKEIRLTGGGEPFLHPNIMEILREAKSKGFKVDITTNFTIMNKKKIDELINIGIDNLTLSLWAYDPETYLLTHPNQSKKTFEKIKENLIYFNLSKKRTKTVISNVISNLNYNGIEKMIDFALETKSDEVYFTMVDPIEKETDSLLLNEEQKNELTKRFIKIKNKYEKGFYKNLKIDNPENFLRKIKNKDMKKGLYDSNIVLDIPCTIGYTFSRIMANGDVAPCCRGVMIPTGNINKNSFIEIWKGEKQKKFRHIGLNLKKYPEFVSKVGCLKSCDNLMHNIQTNGILNDKS